MLDQSDPQLLLKGIICVQVGFLGYFYFHANRVSFFILIFILHEWDLYSHNSLMNWKKNLLMYQTQIMLLSKSGHNNPVPLAILKLTTQNWFF